MDYETIRPLVQKDIQSGLHQYMQKKQFGVARVPAHVHSGVDSGKINPADLNGFPILSAAPTDAPPNGTIRLALVGSTYSLYARINNVWKSATLT